MLTFNAFKEDLVTALVAATPESGGDQHCHSRRMHNPPLDERDILWARVFALLDAAYPATLNFGDTSRVRMLWCDMKSGARKWTKWWVDENNMLSVF